MHPTMRRHEMTVRHLGNELLVYDHRDTKVHSLNAASAFVFQCCDGRTSETQLAELLREHMGVADAASVVSLALDQLRRRHLLEAAPSATTPSAAQRLSRRDALRQLAAAAIALPVIATITPKASAGFLVSGKKLCPSGMTECGARALFVLCCAAGEACDTAVIGSPVCVPIIPPTPTSEDL
ncbi:MAG: HPr-rel-A system PqqD family peptide chaperone [Gemmataceae bacterium]